MSELYSYINPADFEFDTVNPGPYTISTVWSDYNEIYNKPSVYYPTDSNYKVGDILYTNPNGEYEVHSLASTGQLPNLDPEKYQPTAICCIPGYYMKDGKSRFMCIRTDTTLNTVNYDINAAFEYNSGLLTYVNGNLGYVKFEESADTQNAFSIPFEYDSNLGTDNVYTGDNLQPSINPDIYWKSGGDDTLTILGEIPPQYCVKGSVPNPDIFCRKSGENLNAIGDFDGYYNTKEIMNKIPGFNQYWIRYYNLGYYVPSLGELILMYGNYATIRNVLNLIKKAGFDIRTSNQVISSTWASPGKVWVIDGPVCYPAAPQKDIVVFIRF